MTVSPTPPPTSSATNATVTFTPTPPAAPSLWKRVVAKAEAVARNPILRPVEIWALRAALAFLAVKLGLDASKA